MRNRICLALVLLIAGSLALPSAQSDGLSPATFERLAQAATAVGRRPSQPQREGSSARKPSAPPPRQPAASPAFDAATGTRLPETAEEPPASRRPLEVGFDPALPTSPSLPSSTDLRSSAGKAGMPADLASAGQSNPIVLPPGAPITNAPALPVDGSPSPKLVQLVSDQAALAVPTTFGQPDYDSVSLTGHYAFTDGGATALFYRANGSGAAVRVFQRGDAIPGIDGTYLNSFYQPLVNAAGQVAVQVGAYHGGTSKTALIAWTVSSSRVVAFSSDPAPEPGGAAYGTLSIRGQNEPGDVVFTASLTLPGTTASRSAIFLAPAGGGTPVRLAGFGDPAPGTGGTLGLPSSSYVRVNDARDVLFSAPITGGTGGSGIFIRTDSGLAKVAATGDSDLQGSSFGSSASFTSIFLNNLGLAAFRESNRIYVYTPGAGLSLVADLSTPVPAGLGGSFSSLSGPHGFNDAGDLLFTATITGSAATTNGIFLKRSGSALEAIAWKNQAVPGLGGPTFNLFSTPAMNGAAQVAFRASITGAAPVLDGVFKKSPGEGVAAVVIDGAASGLPGGGTLWPGTSVLILADGRLFLEADVAGGTADYAALVASTGGLAALVTTADPLPAGSRVVIRNPWLGARGDWVGFVPRRAGGGSAIYVHRVSTGTNYRVAADGDTAPLPGGGRMRVGGGGSLVNVDGNGNVVFSGVVNGSTSALFRWTPTGGVQKIAAQSDSTPGGAFTSFTLASLGPSPISNAGHVAFRASIPISAIYVAPPSGQPSKIADANTMVPPGTTYFSTLTGSPIVNSNGRVAFKATTRVMGSAGSTEGIHVGEAGTGTSRVAAIGDVTAWGIISAMSVPLSMNDAGEVLFSATLDGGSAGGGLFTGTGSGPIQAVALDAAPSPDGGTFSISSSLLQARIDNEGRVVFCSLLTGGAAPSGMFLRKSASGPTVAVALEGTPAPGTDGTLGVMSPESINSVPGGEYLTLGPAGEVFAYVSVLRTGGTGKAGLFRYRTDSVLEKVAIVGDPIPGGSGVGTVFAVAQMPAAGDPGRFFTYLPTDQGDGIWMTTGTISMGDLNHLYDGTPHPVSVAATPSSLVASVVYTGRGGTVYGPSAAPPSAAGTYDVTASANDAGTPIFETATLTIERAPVAVNVTGLLQTYDGTRRAATVTTTPAGLAVTTTYTGADATSYGPTQVPPTAAGTYAVLAVVVDPNHVGLATGAMKIVSPPAITSASATAFTKEQYAQFTVTATGYPTPAISSTGSLPVGLTFTDNGNGTATIAGTPSWIVSEGTYPVAIIASNGVSPDASQPFTLTVSNASVTISGYVLTAGGGGVSDVSMSGLPGTPRTNAAGYYAATLPSGWSGTVMPLRAGWSFSPPSSAFTNLTSAANADFEETAAGNAVFDAVRHVPACAAGEASCDSGTLLAGRGTMAGGSEPNQPNTLFDSCPDGSQGTYESDQSIERIRVSSLDGSPLSAGGQAAIDVTLWASTYEDVLDLFYTSDASAPEWILAATIPARPGRNQVLSTVVALPGGASQAVRAKLRYRGDRAPCGTGGLVDHDDLAFSVSGTDVSIANATAIWGSTVQVPITALADGNEHAIAFTAEFEAALVSYDGVSLGSGSLANGAVLNLDPRPAEGRIGIVVLMPPGQVFPAGRWEIAVLQLIAQSGSGVAESGIRFGDLIYARQVEAASGAALPAAWHDAQLTLGEVRVSSVSPDRGVTTGDQEVTITGSGFVPGVTSVSIGGSPSKSVNVTSPGSLTAITPPGVQGPADVVVSVPSGSGMLEGGFLYEAPRAANVAPDLSIRLSHTGVFLLGSPGVYTISVSNNGAAATTGEVVVVNTLPSGLSFVSASGAGWTCMGEGTNVGCRYSLPLQPASLSRAEVEITVAVSSGAASQVTNTARTWTAGDAGSAEDNIASDLIFIAGTGFGETPFLAADYEHTCALTAAGGVVCWGDNANGRLGDGTTLARSMPVPVVGLSRGVGAVSAGIYHACALTTAGGVKCWGDNAWGELGDGTTTPSSTPLTSSG